MKWEKTKILTLGFLMMFLLAGLLSCEKAPDDADQVVRYVHPAEAALPKETFTIGGENFEVELAFTQAARRKGLMFRKKVGEHEGMFFVFRYPRIQSFYMKNCLVDIDIVFIKENGRIDKINTMTVPVAGKTLKRYLSASKVRFVLELAAGTCERLGLEAGQFLKLPERIFRIIPDLD